MFQPSPSLNFVSEGLQRCTHRVGPNAAVTFCTRARYLLRHLCALYWRLHCDCLLVALPQPFPDDAISAPAHFFAGQHDVVDVRPPNWLGESLQASKNLSLSARLKSFGVELWMGFAVVASGSHGLSKAVLIGTLLQYTQRRSPSAATSTGLVEVEDGAARDLREESAIACPSGRRGCRS